MSSTLTWIFSRYHNVRISLLGDKLPFAQVTVGVKYEFQYYFISKMKTSDITSSIQFYINRPRYLANRVHIKIIPQLQMAWGVEWMLTTRTPS
jgi:hypothetical protein